MGTFSILYYDNVGKGYTEYAADWNWVFFDEWARSEKDGPDGQWLTICGLDEKAYQAVLERFGLKEWANEFPKDRLIVMSPQMLIAGRRKKEEAYKLPKKEVISDTLGYHVPAESHPELHP